MSYADGLLSSGERILYRTKQHPFIFIWGARYAMLAILIAAESGIERMHMLRDLIAFKKTMLDAKHNYEVDMERSGWAPSPPLRADSGDGVPALAAMPGSARVAVATPAPMVASQPAGT